MNWLIAHPQEIIIGIFTSAVVAIAGYLLNRWFESKKQSNGPVQTARWEDQMTSTMGTTISAGAARLGR